MTRTALGYHIECTECGYYGIKDDEELAIEIVSWHNDRDHDGRSVATVEADPNIPLKDFPEWQNPSEDADVGSEHSATTVGRSGLEVRADD